MKIVLLTPRRRFIANRVGLGYQVPLGLVFLGGPLVDAGHDVRLIDNDVHGWDDDGLLRRMADDPPDCVMIGHTGSTAAHPAAMKTARALRQRLPTVTIVYGGVYPTYTSRSVLEDNPAVDIVVRGEGEQTVAELGAALDEGRRDLGEIRGITWRDGERIVSNPPRPPIQDLDSFRPAWELVDWSAYRLFGLGRAAGMQFSRGCTLRCTYCGQWSFWRRWRHRSPDGFVDQLELLAKKHAVRVVWFADENFAPDRELVRSVLEKIVERDLGLSLNLNMTAADVVRDQDLMPLYRRAGVDNIVLGIESLDDATVSRVGKNNPFRVSREAVKILRRHGIVSLVNVIYGLQHESWKTIWRSFSRLRTLDPDVLNAVYLTPHSWTAEGRQARPYDAIQPDLSRYTYRNQVLDTPALRPWALFAAVKSTEALFHLRLRGLVRLATGADRRFRKIYGAYLKLGVRVFCAEVLEFLTKTRFVRRGTLKAVPGFPVGGTHERSVRELTSTRT